MRYRNQSKSSRPPVSCVVALRSTLSGHRGSIAPAARAPAGDLRRTRADSTPLGRWAGVAPSCSGAHPISHQLVVRAQRTPRSTCSRPHERIRVAAQTLGPGGAPMKDGVVLRIRGAPARMSWATLLAASAVGSPPSSCTRAALLASVGSRSGTVHSSFERPKRLEPSDTQLGKLALYQRSRARAESVRRWRVGAARSAPGEHRTGSRARRGHPRPSGARPVAGPGARRMRWNRLGASRARR